MTDRSTVGVRNRRRGPLGLLLLLSLTAPACASGSSEGGGHGGGGTGGASGATCDTEGAQQACYPGSAITRNIGECTEGSQICHDGHWGECTGAQLPTDEVCDDLLDNDCNGGADEGCPCEPGTTRACYSGPVATRGIGACTDGVQSCEGSLWATECVGEVLPVVEDICNSIDDDCDGIDEEDPGAQECCVPDCDGKICGSGNGCGGTCQQGSGCCQPSCDGKSCGSGDGCGGTCQQGSGCCISCAGASCGDDNGCGGTCSGSCPWGYTCNANHDCVCAPGFQPSGGDCIPSCGALLSHLGMPDAGEGCCPTPCQAGTFAGGPGDTHDCTYCCSSTVPGQPTCS